MNLFLDKYGRPLGPDTHIDNVNLEPTTAETIERERFLAAWDATKPQLGPIDQLVSFGRLVPDPTLQDGSPIVYVTYEHWLDRYDREKPDFGTIEL